MGSRRVYRAIEAQLRLEKTIAGNYYHTPITEVLRYELLEYKDALGIRAVGALLATVWASTNKGQKQLDNANGSMKNFYNTLPYVNSGKDEADETDAKDNNKAINDGESLMYKYIKYRNAMKEQGIDIG